MKDGVKLIYNAPEVEVMALNQDDVICTSLLSELFGVKLLKKKWSWSQEWTDMLNQEGMEGLY